MLETAPVKAVIGVRLILAHDKDIFAFAYLVPSAWSPETP